MVISKSATDTYFPVSSRLPDLIRGSGRVRYVRCFLLINSNGGGPAADSCVSSISGPYEPLDRRAKRLWMYKLYRPQTAALSKRWKIAGFAPIYFTDFAEWR
jgi:hypothetical protein